MSHDPSEWVEDEESEDAWTAALQAARARAEREPVPAERLPDSAVASPAFAAGWLSPESLVEPEVEDPAEEASEAETPLPVDDAAIDAWVGALDAAVPSPEEVTGPVVLASELAALVEALRAGACALCLGPRLCDGDLRARLTRLLDGLPPEEARSFWPVLERSPLAAAGFLHRRLGEGFASALREELPADAELPEALEALPFCATLAGTLGETPVGSRFLFAGFEGHDLELALLLEALAARGEGEHFLLLPEAGSVEKEELQRAWRLHVLALDDLEPVARALEAPRVEIAVDEQAPDARIETLLGQVGRERSSERRAELLSTVARVLEHELDDPARALTALIAAWQEAPERATWHELERLADAASAWDGITDELGDALERLPASVRAPLHGRLGRPAEQLRALDELAAEAGEAEARALKLEAAELCAGVLADPTAAIARYEALAIDAPYDLQVLRALEGLYERQGRGEAYLDNLARQADAVTDSSERAALYRRLALLSEDALEGQTQAREAWEALLAIEPEADDALRALERLYRAGRAWRELISVLERRAPESPELWAEVGAIYEYELGEPESAARAYEAADAAASTDETLSALARVYQVLGDWARAVEALDRRAKGQQGAEKIELILRAAELCVAHLGDPRAAEARFARVLELEPTHAPAMIGLADTYQKSREPLRAARLYAEAVPHTPNRLERTRLLVEAGRIHHALDQHERATELYLQALAIDPEARAAGEPLSDLLWRAGRHAELVPVLEMLLLERAAPEIEPEVEVERWLRLGHAAHAAGLPDKAGRAWIRAASLAPAHLQAQRACAAHHLAEEHWGEALRALELVFRYHIDELPRDEQVALFSEMARCELKLGVRDGARELVARALELDPRHAPSLLLQVELDEPDPARALAAYEAALQVRPDDHKLLHKVLDLRVAAHEWPEAIDVLERLIAVEPDPGVRARYRHTAGLICRDELKRPAEAIAYLKEALDDDPALDRAWTALEELLRAIGDWRELARLYRLLLKRLGPESPADADGLNRERLRVWSALGALCFDQLGETEAGLTALEVALGLDPRDLERHKRLADLYVQAGPGWFEKSIARHQHILRQEKSRVLSYRALKHLYIQTSQREKSILCSWALEVLRKGEPDDARKVAEHKRRPFGLTRRVFTDDAWARLCHPDEDRLLDQLFAIVGPTLIAGQALSRKALGLQPKDAIAEDDPHSYNKVLKYVTTVLGVERPEAYARPEQRDPVAFQVCLDGRALVPVFLLGAPLVGAERREREQVFEIARRAAHLRPERLLRLAMPHPQALAHVIEAVMVLADDGAAPTGELERTVDGLGRVLPPVQLEQVLAIGRKLRELETRPEAAALAWLEATDLTATRVGWALTGDLETCARGIAAEGQPAGTLAPTQRLLDLVWSSTTEELFAVRRQLGLM